MAELYGPDDGDRFCTAVMDSIVLCKGLRDADLRSYLVLWSPVGFT
ncbi:hypothetical protein [Streptomyces sp. NPDC093589]